MFPFVLTLITLNFLTDREKHANLDGTHINGSGVMQERICLMSAPLTNHAEDYTKQPTLSTLHAILINGDDRDGDGVRQRD